MSQARQILTLAVVAIAMAGCARASWSENPGAEIADQQGQQGAKPTLAFESCASRTLQVDVATVGTQDALKDFNTTMKRFPLVKIKRASASKVLTTFHLTMLDARKHACTEGTCADAAGWTLLQSDCSQLNDVAVTCRTLAAGL